LLHSDSEEGLLTFAVGSTVIVKDLDGPGQLVTPKVTVGVTIIVATTGAVPIFVAVNAEILPVPLAANPMLV
jgi:hypothetical protein